MVALVAMNIKQSPRKFSFFVVLTAVLCAGALHGRREDNSQNAGAGKSGDYRSRTIYVALTDRFHRHDPYQPYIDPQYPNATFTFLRKPSLDYFLTDPDVCGNRCFGSGCVRLQS